MRSEHMFDGYPWKVLLPGAVVSSALVMGVFPAQSTVIALDLGLTLTGVALTIRRAANDGGLALQEADGSLIPVSLAIIVLLASLPMGALFTWPLFVRWSPAPETACLCDRPQGLEATLGVSAGVVALACAQTVVLVALLGAVARLACGRRPRAQA